MVHFCGMISFKIELEQPVVVNCAEDWAELTPEQFIQVVALQLATPANPTDKEKEVFYIGILRMFFQLPKEVFYELPVMESLYAEYFHKAMLFMGEPNTSKSLAPTLLIGDKKYTGSQSHFSGISLEQMAAVEVLMDSYCEDPTEELLNRMVAALYYPYSHQEKEMISAEFDALTNAVAKLDLPARYAAYLNYRSLRHVVPVRCRHLFADGGADSGKTIIEQWEDMFSTLAKDGPQQETEVRRVEAIRALRWLNNEFEKVKKK
jgi:hypothetical protein